MNQWVYAFICCNLCLVTFGVITLLLLFNKSRREKKRKENKSTLLDQSPTQIKLLSVLFNLIWLYSYICLRCIFISPVSIVGLEV
jgi:hypothetical protein